VVNQSAACMGICQFNSLGEGTNWTLLEIRTVFGQIYRYQLLESTELVLFATLSFKYRSIKFHIGVKTLAQTSLNMIFFNIVRIN